MNNNLKGALVVGGVLSAIGLAYYFLVYKKDKKGKGDLYSGFSNFESLQTNLGVKPNKDNIVWVKFNEGKNSVNFYNNDRVIFFNDKNLVVVKGKYLNGGTVINLDNGRVVEGGSVWQNIRDVINKK